MSKRSRLSAAALVAGLVLSVTLGISAVVMLSGGGTSAEAAAGQPIGQIINLTTTEVLPGRYETALADVNDCLPVSAMISVSSDNPNARAFFGDVSASPDGVTKYLGAGSVFLQGSPPPPPPGVPTPFDYSNVTAQIAFVGAPYMSLGFQVNEITEFGAIGPPVAGATVNVAVFCSFGPSGATVNFPFPPAGGPPN